MERRSSLRGEISHFSRKRRARNGAPGLLRDPLEEAFPEDAELFRGAQAYFCREDIVLFFADFLEQAAVDGYQHPQRGLAVFGDVRQQSVARSIKLAGAIGFE